MVRPRDRSLLVALRNGMGLSQRQQGRRLGISWGHVADIERGARQPSYEVACRMAELYGVADVKSLFEEIPLEYGDPAAPGDVTPEEVA